MYNNKNTIIMDSKRINEISEIRKGIFGVKVVTMTEPKMNKTNNPFFGRVQKITEYNNAVLGVEYENAVNGRLEKAGEVADYKATAPKGKKWYNSFFYVGAKDENQFYLKIGIRKNTTIKSQYLLDGRNATEQEVAEIKTFIPERTYEVKKQSEAGLDESEQYRIVAPKIENVITITFGGKTIA